MTRQMPLTESDKTACCACIGDALHAECMHYVAWFKYLLLADCYMIVPRPQQQAATISYAVTLDFKSTPVMQMNPRGHLKRQSMHQDQTSQRSNNDQTMCN